MALTGTLRDFSAADIFQLIGQQAKSGVLHLRSAKGEEVHISFHLGSVVGAEHVSRSKRDLLGSMLLRARLITEEELSAALDGQRRTLRRLGDLLVEQGAISREELREMTQLQVTETLYALFQWKAGVYEFEAREVTWDEDAVTPLRSEAVLMEGYRIVDEWPLVRKKIGSPKNTFKILRPLPNPTEERGATDEASFADLLAEDDDPYDRSERRVMELVAPGRSVDELVDLSRLGAFETWKALANLVEKGHLLQITPSQAELEDRGSSRRWEALARYVPVAPYGALCLLLVGTAAWGLQARGKREDRSSPWAASMKVAAEEKARFAASVYGLLYGEAPSSWEELVEAGLLETSDLDWLRQKSDPLRVVVEPSGGN